MWAQVNAVRDFHYLPPTDIGSSQSIPYKSMSLFWISWKLILIDEKNSILQEIKPKFIRIDGVYKYLSYILKLKWCKYENYNKKEYLQLFPVMKSTRLVHNLFHINSIELKKPFMLVSGGWKGIPCNNQWFNGPQNHMLVSIPHDKPIYITIFKDLKGKFYILYLVEFKPQIGHIKLK